MTRDNLLFTIIGLLLGFIVGFMFASNLAQREASPAAARTQALPPDHPSVGDAPAGTAPAGNPGQMQTQVAAALDKAKKEPNNFEAQVDAAQLYFQIQRYDDSIGYLLKANQLKPDDFETVGNLAIANMEAGHFETAEKWYKAALMKNPNDVRLLDGYCHVLLEVGDAKAAEVAIAQLAKVDPTNSDLIQFRDRLAKVKTNGKGNP